MAQGLTPLWGKGLQSDLTEQWQVHSVQLLLVHISCHVMVTVVKALVSVTFSSTATCSCVLDSSSLVLAPEGLQQCLLK